MARTCPCQSARALLIAAGAVAVLSGAASDADAAPARRPVLPEIRVSSATEGVPACVTPARLTRHLLERTPNLDPRFRDIAKHYKVHGEALGLRWDYAFYQMLLETNYLSYKRDSGRQGDVGRRQNNFAGIGATGGGVAGDSFPDVSTGVLAQMQHLVAYSGERVAKPVAPRTRERQDDIVALSRALRRPVRFDDLTNRWAKDRNYAKSIEWVAERYRSANCTETGAPLRAAADDAAANTRAAVALAPRAAATTCDVFGASYGGSVAVLIRSVAGTIVNYTVLQVEEGREQSQTDAFLEKHMPDGQTIARFDSRERALARAFELCPAPPS